MKEVNNRIGLYLDDVRTVTEKPPYIDEWKIVRSYEEFKNFLYDFIKENKELPAIISFDHDLSNEHMQYYFDHPEEPIPYQDFVEKTGVHCAKLLINLAQVNNLRINYVSVHSHNPIGAQNIQMLINNYLKVKGEPADCFLMKFKHTT